MGFKERFFNSFAVLKKQKVNSSIINSHYKNKIIHTLVSICDNLTNFSATLRTPKSRINLVYNFGENVDLIISFAKIGRKSVMISKGLSKQLRRRKISFEEWNQFESTDQTDVKLIFQTGKCPVLVLEVNDDPQQGFCQLLSIMNEWAVLKYPLVLGVDVTETLNIPAVKLLSTVLGNKALKFVFYNYRSSSINFLNIPVQPILNSTEYPVGFFEGNTKHEKYLNTMIELRILLEQTDAENAKIYKEILTDISVETSGGTINSIIRRGMNIFDNKLRRYLFRTTAHYRMGYCLEGGGSYVAYNDEERVFDTTERYILVTRDTQIMLNGELTSKLKKINIDMCKLPKIKWIEGVPGCGKSWWIVSEHTPGKDLILSQTRAGIRDIRDIVALHDPHNKTNLQLNKDYRTVASYIINHTSKGYNRVFIDECLMMHAGYIGFIAELSGAEEIVVVGDSQQIPYIERSSMKTRWYKLSEFCDPSENLTTTRRCPVDICYALSSHYENLATTNTVLKSVQPTVRNGDFHQLEPDTLVLAFTQKEKIMLVETLKRYKKLAIHTIHEAQGLTSKRVVLVRIDSAKKEIYNSIPHAIVALSRHTESFRYLTTGTEDAVLLLIEKLKYKTEEELMLWNSNRIINVTRKFNCTNL